MTSIAVLHWERESSYYGCLVGTILPAGKRTACYDAEWIRGDLSWAA